MSDQQGRGPLHRTCQRIAKSLPCTLLTALLALTLSTPAQAHKGSDAYLGVSGDQALSFTLAVALKDLDLLLPLDANGDALITWHELQAALPAVIETLKQNTSLTQDIPGHSASLTIANSVSTSTLALNRCALDWRYSGLETRSDGSYLRVAALAVCDPTQPLAFRYSLFAKEDVTHRLIVAGRVDGHDLLLSVAPDATKPFALRQATQPQRPGSGTGAVTGTGTPQGIWATLSAYFLQGAEHLLQGYDHLAFLLALLLPLPLRLPSWQVWRLWNSRSAPGLRSPTAAAAAWPAQALQQRQTWGALVRTVTAFTLGHSITLILAVLGYTSASPAWVEPAIALSIGVSAGLNLLPRLGVPTAGLAAVFGLVHGYGFAGLLTQAAAPSGLLGWALAGFNLGIEAGQLLVVFAWVSLSQWVSGKAWYPLVVVRGGSVLLVALSLYWLVQRVG